MTTKNLNELFGLDFISAIWGEDATHNIENAIRTYNIQTMSMDEFLTHCTACGGNWGGMLLSGLRQIYPDVWDAIPDDMGVYAWPGICEVLSLCGVILKE